MNGKCDIKTLIRIINSILKELGFDELASLELKNQFGSPDKIIIHL